MRLSFLAIGLLPFTYVASAAPQTTVKKRDATFMSTTVMAPARLPSQHFEYTTDNGASWSPWKTQTGNLRLGPRSSAGYRLKGQNSSAVLYQNTLPPADAYGEGDYTWITYESGPNPYLVGLAYNNIYLYSDFTMPSSTNMSDVWTTVELPTRVQISNAGGCAIQPFSAKVFYTAASGLAPATFTSANGSALQFAVTDGLKLDKIIFSFGAHIQRGGPNPLLKRLNNAAKGPQTTAVMEILGQFCIGLD